MWSERLLRATKGGCARADELRSLAGARALDKADALRAWRDEFCIPDVRDDHGSSDADGDRASGDGEGCDVASAAAAAATVGAADGERLGAGAETIYLCGNSLGAQPARARARVLAHLDAWRHRGVSAHFGGEEPWMPIEDRAIECGGAEVVGALPHEVVYMNSLTVNLHLMMVAFYRPAGPRRYKVLMEPKAFPSDRYAVASQVAYHGHDPDEAIVHIEAGAAQSDGGAACSDGYLAPERIEAAVRAHADDLALVLLPGVHYFTGQVLPIERIVRAVRAASPHIRVGFDLAHAAGNVPLQLHAWAPDFACWCTYKYLNGGPGAIAGCFVHEQHAHRTSTRELPRFGGWWGNERQSRFLMEPEFRIAAGANGFQLSNPPVLALAPVLASLEVIRAAGGMQALRRKSIMLTGYLQWLLDATPTLARHVQVITPLAEAERGCQLSLRLGRDAPPVKRVHAYISRRGVVCDTREPDIMRVAPVPLYNSFEDVYRFAQAVADALDALCP